MIVAVMVGVKSGQENEMGHKKYPTYFLKFPSFLAALGLRCSLWASSSCGKQGLPWSCGTWTSLGVRALGCAGSAVAVHGLSCPTACGVFPDQGLNPCSLYWQAKSDHQGSPVLHISFLFLQFYVCYISRIYGFCVL